MIESDLPSAYDFPDLELTFFYEVLRKLNTQRISFVLLSLVVAA